MKQAIKKVPAQIVVEETAEWKTVYDRFSHDFIAILTDIGPIGIARTKDGARRLISDYTFESLRRAA